MRASSALVAHVLSSIFSPCLRAASLRNALDEGATAVQGGVVRVQPKGFVDRVHDAFSFGPPRPVQQLVHRFHFSMVGTPMEQLELLLLGRIDAPAVVPPKILQTVRTYRAAVRLCWTLRRAKGLKPIDLAREFGFTRQHVTDYLHHDDKATRRSLPAERIKDFEDVCGNAAITQWLAARARLTVLEELQAERAAA